MSDEIKLVLSDKQIVPSDDLIYSLIGEKQFLWKTIVKHTTDSYKDVFGSWNYYNDGKQWLFKLVQKKKTIFWAGVLADCFRISFYFGDKAEPFIEGSRLPQKIKDDFKTSKRYGALRAISVRLIDESDIEVVKELVSVKLKIK
jgi:hypothetical protein